MADNVDDASLARCPRLRVVSAMLKGVDEGAIADALDAWRLGGYAADVFAMEDWMMLPDHPGPPAAPSPHPLHSAHGLGR